MEFYETGELLVPYGLVKTGLQVFIRDTILNENTFAGDLLLRTLLAQAVGVDSTAATKPSGVTELEGPLLCTVSYC